MHLYRDTDFDNLISAVLIFDFPSVSIQLIRFVVSTLKILRFVINLQNLEESIYKNKQLTHEIKISLGQNIIILCKNIIL